MVEGIIIGIFAGAPLGALAVGILSAGKADDAYRAGRRDGERNAAPLNEHEAAMYDRFVTYLIQQTKAEERARA